MLYHARCPECGMVIRGRGRRPGGGDHCPACLIKSGRTVLTEQLLLKFVADTGRTTTRRGESWSQTG
jgi:hypothetical protein